MSGGDTTVMPCVAQAVVVREVISALKWKQQAIVAWHIAAARLTAERAIEEGAPVGMREKKLIFGR